MRLPSVPTALLLSVLAGCGTKSAPSQPCENRSACERSLGVCTNAQRACIDGIPEQVCTSASYGPHFESEENTCDGLDNDCDGTVDNLVPHKLSDRIPDAANALAFPRSWRSMAGTRR